jgi:flavodoxin
MMRIKLLSAFVFFMCLNISCNGKSTAVPQEVAPPIEQDSSKILIVYLSRANNTEAVAEMIQDFVGGDMVELQLEDPYPENYREIVDQVDRENETGYLPPLKTEIENIQGYDTVFLGFPTWDMQLPPPMKSFLNKYDLGGKTVIPFNTNGGYGIGSSFNTVETLCQDCNILEGYSTKGGVERDEIYFVMEGEKRRDVQAEIEKWLQRIGVTQ